MTKHFVIGLVPAQYYSLSYGLGRTQHLILDQDACLPVVNNYWLDLKYAQIDNEEYGLVAGITDENRASVGSFRLEQNYPNPFNPTTTIEVSLSKACPVTLRIFNTLGEIITTLVSRELAAGIYKFEWNAASMPSGLYFCRVQAGSGIETRKLMLLR